MISINSLVHLKTKEGGAGMEGGFSLLLSCPLCPGYYSFYQMTDDKEPIQSRDTQSRAKQEGRGVRRGRTLGVYKKFHLWSPSIPWMGGVCCNKVCHFAPFSLWIAFLGSQSICHPYVLCLHSLYFSSVPLIL